MPERDKSIIDFNELLFKSGALSRSTHALEKHPQGLTLEDICIITGLSPSTVRNKAIPKLLHFQLVEKTKTEDKENPFFKMIPRPMIVEEIRQRIDETVGFPTQEEMEEVKEDLKKIGEEHK